MCDMMLEIAAAAMMRWVQRGNELLLEDWEAL